jgi:hypothetical protein
VSVPRDELVARLRGRRIEIEQALLARTSSVTDETPTTNPEYLEGLRAAISAAVEYSLSVIESGGREGPLPIPTQIISQARLAARHSVGLDTVARRYIVGSHLLNSFILEEIDPRDWEPLHRDRAAALDLLLREVSAEYKRVQAHRSRSRYTERLDRVERLLKGEPVDPSKLEYDLDLHHVALIAKGHGAETPLRHLARLLDSRLLLVRPDEDTIWAWIGRSREVDHSWLCANVSSHWDPRILLAVGEPAAGVGGWRRSHRQAQSALVVAQRGISAVSHYRRDCLLASLLLDESLSSLLWSLYVAPLLGAGDRGPAYLHTLRAYLEANRNGASAAAALGVSRQTVANHLRAIEDRIEMPISAASVEIELALRLQAAGFTPAGADRHRAPA